MHYSRRRFLRNSGLTVAGAALFHGSVFAAAKSTHIVGIQLYSVRDDMAKDPSGTLKELSAMGYKYVEHANYKNRKFYGYDPADFKKLLNDLGMEMKSGHTFMGKDHWDASKNDFTDLWKYTLEDAAFMGQEYVISPGIEDSYRQDYDVFKNYMDVFNKCGELCKKSGLKFGYHNHSFEFNTTLNNMKIYDIILQHTDADLVAQQLDIGNMYGVGARAVEIIQQYPGRFELMHVKDEIKTVKGEMNDGYESAVLGTGVVGVKDVVDLALKSGGTRHFIIEQESYQDKTPLNCAQEDLVVMKKWRFC